MFWVPCWDVLYNFCLKTVRSFFTSSCLYEDSCLIYITSACLHKVVSNTYCIVFFFVLCTLCCQFLWIVPSVFSNVYLHKSNIKEIVGLCHSFKEITNWKLNIVTKYYNFLINKRKFLCWNQTERDTTDVSLKDRLECN